MVQNALLDFVVATCWRRHNSRRSRIHHLVIVCFAGDADLHPGPVVEHRLDAVPVSVGAAAGRHEASG